MRDSNMAVVGDLEPRQGYCFSVAAFIPSRDPRSQLGAWSQQHCLPANKSLLQGERVHTHRHRLTHTHTACYMLIQLTVKGAVGLALTDIT